MEDRYYVDIDNKEPPTVIPDQNLRIVFGIIVFFVAAHALAAFL